MNFSLRQAGLLFALLAFFMLQACATHAEIRGKLVTDVRCGAYALAEKRLAEIEGYSEKDILMDVLDRAMIAHLEGRYADSNQLLERGKELIESYFTKDISDELAAIAWNDTERAWQGEEFERIMVNMLAAFNYLQMGDPENAAVEARQINQRLQVYVDKLKKYKVKTSYVQDPFAQYLAGMIQEAVGDYADAFISYKDAWEGYEQTGRDFKISAPSSLRAALIRAAELSENDEEADRYRKMFPEVKPPSQKFLNSHGRLVVITASGGIARKYSAKWIIPDPELDTFVVYYPKYGKGVSRTRGIEIKVDGKNQKVEVAHDLTALARKTLDEKSAQLKGKAVAKAIAMYAAKKVTKNVAKYSKNDTAQAVSILANVALNVVDLALQADTRSWMTLPDKLGISSAYVKPGRQTAVVYFAGSAGEIFDRQVVTFDIKAGQTLFMVVRSREPHPDGRQADPAAKPLWNLVPQTPQPNSARPAVPVSLLIPETSYNSERSEG